jgi:putative tryptophan/tyrosine transport system substrate-binding protein
VLSRFDTAGLVRPYVLAIGLAAVLAALTLWVMSGRFGAMPALKPIHRVVYVGSDGASADRTYQDMAAALQKLNSKSQIKLNLEYATVPIMPLEPKKIAISKLLAGEPAVLIAPTASTALAASQLPRKATAVVFSSSADPVRGRIVNSMRGTGALITGVSLADEWHAKRIELLRDAFPVGHRLGVLLDRNWFRNEDFALQIGQPAQAHGYVATPFLADAAEEASSVLVSPEALGMDAWYIPRNFIAFIAEKEIIAHLRRNNIPAVHGTQQAVANGALMAFAQDTSPVGDMLADLTLRILRGEDAGSIPIQRPKKFILAVRPREEPGTPQINPSVIRRADRVY